jgi:hypothetical protein
MIPLSEAKVGLAVAVNPTSGCVRGTIARVLKSAVDVDICAAKPVRIHARRTPDGCLYGIVPWTEEHDALVYERAQQAKLRSLMQPIDSNVFSDKRTRYKGRALTIAEIDMLIEAFSKLQEQP